MAKRGRPRSFDRAAALEQAMLLFQARGYEGVSLAELTAAMAVNPPSLYAAFGSKEALFREAVALDRQRDFGAIEAALATEGTARAAIAAMLAAAAAAFSAPGRPAGSLAILGAVNCAVENAGLRDFLAENRRETARLIAARLARAQADGEIETTVDGGAIAGFCASVVNGMALAAFDGARAAELAAIADHAMAGFDAFTRSPVAELPEPAATVEAPAARPEKRAARTAKTDTPPQLQLF
jgi:AcrR family transcriptional regulator